MNKLSLITNYSNINYAIYLIGVSSKLDFFKKSLYR